jgi:hypothetical protein
MGLCSDLRETAIMSETTTFEAPLVPVPPPSKFEREHAAFLRLLPSLLATYRGKHVAIHEEQVVDSDVNDIALLLRVHGKYGYIPIYVSLVTDEPRRIERVPWYRTIRS